MYAKFQLLQVNKERVYILKLNTYKVANKWL